VEIMQLLRRLARETGRAVLLSTHDLDLALRLADRLWLMPGDGTLHMDTPEDLVLSGALGSAFHSSGAAFDLHSGTFTIQDIHRGTVALTGGGLAETWARRALQRTGYAITTNGDPASARIEALDSTPPRWRLIQGDSVQEYAALGDLLAAVQAIPHIN
jgi:iron complex transport system ATP-binding protein